MTLTDSIRRRARELGFQLVGFAPAQPLAQASFYARWVALGFAGEMDYLERNLERRADPARMVPGARTVICLGMDYYQETAPSPAGARGSPGGPHAASLAHDPPAPPPGRIACYARGDDYHDLVKKRLHALWNWIREAAGRPVRGREYVDTAPVLERALAQRAGLGWQGKNTCLINERRGSFFFLAEIILDLELEWDKPATDHCGTCTRCLEACPTDAFPEPHVLDARRCISYLTIELKGPIPRHLRPQLGHWIFGCDRCQDVCPWNRRAAPAAEPALASRPHLDHPALVGLLGMDQREFSEHFRRSPVKRAKRRGLLRNVAVALGNAGSAAAVPALIRALDDGEPLVRGHAAWALGRIGGAAAGQALREALEREDDAQVVQELREAFEMLAG